MISFPEYTCNCHVGSMKALIFDGTGICYNLIIGYLALKKMQLQLDFHHEKTIWFNNKGPFQPLASLVSRYFYHSIGSTSSSIQHPTTSSLTLLLLHTSKQTFNKLLTSKLISLTLNKLTFIMSSLVMSHSCMVMLELTLTNSSTSNSSQTVSLLLSEAALYCCFSTLPITQRRIGLPRSNAVMKPFAAWASLYSLRKTRRFLLFKTYFL
jgi:hypothetical protein